MLCLVSRGSTEDWVLVLQAGCKAKEFRSLIVKAGNWKLEIYCSAYMLFFSQRDLGRWKAMSWTEGRKKEIEYLPL